MVYTHSSYSIEEEISDTDTHDGRWIYIENHDYKLVRCKNDADKEVSVYIYGADRNDIEKFSTDDPTGLGEQLIGSFTVSASSNDYETITEDWQMLRAKVEYSVSPTNGEDIIVGLRL